MAVEDLIKQGEIVKTKEYGTVEVTDLRIGGLLRLMGDLPTLFEYLETVRESNDSQDATKTVLGFLQTPEAEDFVLKLVAEILRKPYTEVLNNPPSASDTLKLVAAFWKVADLEELSEAFFQLIPQKESSSEAAAKAPEALATP